MGCSGASNLQFGLVAAGAALTCNGERFILPSSILPDNCETILDRVAAFGLSSTLPLTAADRCDDRLWVSITQARPSGVPGVSSVDREVKVSTFPSRSTLIEAILASSYVPGFSGTTTVKEVNEFIAPNVQYVYDGVCTNPLPVPPSKPLLTGTVAMTKSCRWDFWHCPRHGVCGQACTLL
jgi:hypothetical protein